MISIKRTFGLEYAICMFLMFFITISYGHSTSVYTAAMILLVLYTYCKFILSAKRMPIYFVYAGIYISTVPVIIGLLRGQFQDVLMANCSVLFTLVVASFPETGDENNEYRTFIFIGMFAIVIDLLKSRIPFLNTMNSNSYSFLIFLSFSIVFIAARMKKNIVSVLMLLYCGYALSHSGSRNALVIYIVMAALVFIPYKAATNKIVYRVIYTVSLGFQCVSRIWFEYVENNKFLTEIFNDVTTPYVHKAWGVENRVEVYENASKIIWNQDKFRLIFGNGKAFRHAHNGFYQPTYLYGLIGFVLIIVMYVMIFEMALKLMNKKHDGFVLGCIISLCGMFLLQGADVFLFGCKTCTVLPFLLSGVILRKYLAQKQSKSDVSKVENRYES